MKKIIFVLSIALLISACKKKNEAVKIGIIAPLTGEGATYGDAMKKGFDLAFDDDEKYQLIYEDSKLDPKEGVNAINKLINLDKVEVVYGAAASSVTLAIAPEAQRNKTIVFSSISTADDIKNSGDFIFRNVPSNLIQGSTAANFLMDLGIKDIAVLKENDDYGNSIAKSFVEQIIKNKGQITIEESYVSTDNDFKTQLLKIKESRAKGIFIPGNYEESAIILKQLKELGIELPVIGGDGSYSEDLIKVAGKSSEGFYCTHFGINIKDDFYENFVVRFRKIYKREPNVYEAYAYEAGTIIREALETVGNDATKVRDYLLSKEFNSLTGLISFNSFGEVERTFGVLQIKDGKFENIR